MTTRELFKNFSDISNRVKLGANRQIMAWNHEYFGGEHLLVGLTEEADDVVTTLFRAQGVTKDCIRPEIEQFSPPGPPVTPVLGPYPPTPRTRNIIEFAEEEARNAGSTKIEPIHLLLGCLRETGGTAAKVLAHFKITLDSTRQFIAEHSPGTTEASES